MLSPAIVSDGGIDPDVLQPIFYSYYIILVPRWLYSYKYHIVTGRGYGILVSDRGREGVGRQQRNGL